MHSGQIMGGRYRLEERVDSGAMGEVWRGTDTRLSRTVAVKILHASLSTTPAFRQRFAAEARSAAALRAPGVVDLYDYGEDTGDDGVVVSYLVMEFVKGRSLAQVLAERGTIPPGETMKMMGQAAAALEAAHQAGIVHRDIKPGNILLREDGETKIVDFGIARAHGESGLTSTGQVMGTVAYVSPEQLYDEELTGASDVYSLGVVAYECLSGAKPFHADAPAAIIRAQLHDDPPPLPAEVPAEVSAVVMKCLAKQPEDRWIDGATLAAECRRLAAKLPQGDTTEAMEAVSPDTGPIRAAVPLHDTQSFSAASGSSDSLDSKSASDRKRAKVAGLVAAGVLVLVALVLTAVIQSWFEPKNSVSDSPNTKELPQSESTQSPSEETEDPYSDDWSDPTSDPDPTTSSPSPTETSPSDDPTSSDSPSPTDTSPDDDPSSPSPSDGEGDADGLLPG